MTPEERQLIADLFARMRGYGAPEKDRDAETLINQSVRANPDAAYMLVQSVLVQEQALQAANDRVVELEEQLRAQDGAGARGARSGGFLGGFWGGRGEEPRSSVPQVGSRATPSAYSDRPPSAWGHGGAQPQQQPAQASSGGGSFMKSALATAAGVAGGMLLADSIRSMMSGGAHASQAHTHEEITDARYIDESDNDPGTYDASGDSSFDSGGDIEV
jgi:hypothetical protein